MGQRSALRRIVAVTLAPHLLAALEARRKVTGESRSRLLERLALLGLASEQPDGRRERHARRAA